MNMRLLGAPTLPDVVPAMVDASALSHHSAGVPNDILFEGNCSSLRFLALRCASAADPEFLQ